MRKALTPIALIVAIGFLWRLVIAFYTPVIQDEAYYFDWASRLQPGYFDHPPGVAVAALTTHLGPGSWFFGRLGVLVLGTGTLLVLANLYRNLGFKSQQIFWAVVLLSVTPFILGIGLLVTPDAPLCFGWALSLHEMERALFRSPKRWISAGTCVGVALLSKYTALLLFPLAFIFVLVPFSGRIRQYPVFYCFSVVAAITVFSPNIFWNICHHWVSFGFQLPRATSALHTAGLNLESFQPNLLNKLTHWLVRAVLRVLEFGLVQFLAWGALSIVFFVVLLVKWKSIIQWLRLACVSISWQTMSDKNKFLLIATVVPLSAFACLALVARVEANWPMVYSLSAAPLVVQLIASVRLQYLLPYSSIASIFLISIPTLVLARGRQFEQIAGRLNSETVGFESLARFIDTLHESAFGNRYQDVAMFRFYLRKFRSEQNKKHANHRDSKSFNSMAFDQEPGPFMISQWPGSGRSSEYFLGQIAPKVDVNSLPASFWLIGDGNGYRESISGFKKDKSLIWIRCPGASEIVRIVTHENDIVKLKCKRPIRNWLINHFQKLD